MVAGMQGDGSEPWYRMARFPTQDAAIAYAKQLLSKTAAAQVDEVGV